MNYVLQNGEYFNNLEEAVINLKANTEVYYIKKDNKPYVAWVDFITKTEKVDGMDILIEEKNYYSVLDGELVLKESIKYDLHTLTELENNNLEPTFVILLSQIFNIKGNETRFLSLDDIKSLLAFKEEEPVNQDPKCKRIF